MNTNHPGKMHALRWLKATAWAATLASSLLQYTTASASLLDIDPVPLFIGGSVTPNVFFMLDNSGSMDWDILAVNHWAARSYDRYTLSEDGSPEDKSEDYKTKVENGQWYGVGRDNNGGSQSYYYYIYKNPDNVHGNTCRGGYNVIGSCTTTTNDWRLYSAALNVLYYNPDITYKPWRGLSDASFTAARSHPISGHTYKGSTGYNSTRDLTGFVYYVWTDDKGFSGAMPRRGTNINYTTGGNGMVDLWDSRTKYTVNAGSITVEQQSCNPNMSTGALNCTTTSTSTISDSATVQAAQKNIANWYQYSRRRYLLAAGAVDQVTAAKTSFRYGINQINRSSQLFVELPAASVTDYPTYTTNMVNAMFKSYYAESGTPLRSALKRAGDYYSGTLTGKTNPILYSCQQNYTILLSDGYWNSDALGSIIGEKDGDTKTDTLADVAWYYYNTDLSSSLPDKVPTNPGVCDLKQSQHMVNFTVAFGIEGLLSDDNKNGWPDTIVDALPDDDGDGCPNEPNLADSNPNWWGSVAVDNTDKPAKVDDMWHAAWNSRGAFYSAKNPRELVDGLTDALSAIEKRAARVAAGSYTNPFIKPNASTRFVGSFDSTDWSGSLSAENVNTGAELWNTKNANSKFSQQSWSSRNIFSYDPTTKQGIPFGWDSLNDAQKLALQRNPGTLVDEGVSKGRARLEFLQGRGINEPGGNTWLTSNNFRKRSTKLGDIVNSESFYLDTKDVVFVGANDGMLHAFDAKDGTELFAYVPSRLFGKLNRLTDPSYAHTWYVDGSVDIKTVGSRQILVGTLRGGAQSVFALDVTNPASFNQNNVLWEFSDSDDKDLGYVFGSPTITRMHDGTKAVLISNGYNNSEADGYASSTGYAALYVLNVETGAVFRKFLTNVGSATTPNGLAAPANMDANLDGIVDFIYAGDLAGNLWKFDVTAASSTQWNIPFGTTTAPKPLFTATSSSGVAQPITIRPQVNNHPDYAGYLVYFGTGKYIEVNDKTTNYGGMQTVYGVWDRYSIDNTATPKDPNGLHPFNRSKLLQQKIIAQVNGRYVISDNQMIWHNDFDSNDRPKSNPTGTPPKHLGWFLDLNQTIGERVVVDVEVRGDKLIVNTMIPTSSDDPCIASGNSNTLIISAKTGSRLSYSVFDVNEDQKFDTGDFVVVTIDGVPTLVPVSSSHSTGFLSRPTILDNLLPPGGPGGLCPVGTFAIVSETTTGSPSVVECAPDEPNLARQSWRQLIQP